jgi:cytochrome o ubiquinol oxidase subunit 2
MEASRYKSIISRVTVLLAVLSLSGCKFALLDPAGDVGVQIKELILTSLFLMLIVVVPVILMTIFFVYKYRESNTQQKEYAPDWSHSNKIEFVVWTVPIIIIVILAVITWRSTHHLEPSNPLVSDEETMTIEVVSLDWKWLFIYPEENIATVNYVAFPKDVPVKFKITSDNIMNSFFIPRLGSQIYAMPGMVTRLHLISREARDYRGIAASYSGEGFSDMKFTATALESRAAFKQWVEEVKHKSDAKVMTSFDDYRELAKPSIADPVSYYSSVPKDLFSSVVTQFPGGMVHGHGIGMDEAMTSHGDMAGHGEMGAMKTHASMEAESEHAGHAAADH